MALEKQIRHFGSIDFQTGDISIQTITVIMEDEKEISRTEPHRAAHAAGDIEIDQLPADVRSVVRALWTPDKVCAHQEMQALARKELAATRAPEKHQK